MKIFLTLGLFFCSFTSHAAMNGAWAGKVNLQGSDGYAIDIECKLKIETDSLFVRIEDPENCTYLANRVSEFEIDGHELLSGNTKVGTVSENQVELFEVYTDGQWRLTLLKNQNETLSVKELYTETTAGYSEQSNGELAAAK